MSTEHYQGDEFPIHIDLGKMPDESGPEVASPGKGKKRKPYYPSLYISNIKGLEDLPKDGCALIEFHRGNVSVNTPDDGEPSSSVELQIKTLCLMEPSGDGEDMKSAMAKFAKGEGVDVGDEARDETDDENDGGEE